MTYVFRAAGLVLLALVVVPFYRLLDRADAGLFLRGGIGTADLTRTLLFVGSLIVLVAAGFASRFVTLSTIDRALARLGNRLVAIPTPLFAVGLGVIAMLLTLVFSLVVLEGKPNLIDAMVQLAHARFVAEGQLSGPARHLEFWTLQNSLVTPNGWVSQYPPGFIFLLAAGFRLGVVELVGPFFAGLTVLFTVLAAERLLREDKVTARLGALLLCFSPFFLGLAAAYMNHVGAAAFATAAIYSAVRSRDEGTLRWAFLSGAAAGGVFSIRPMSAIVCAAVVAVVWLLDDTAGPGGKVGAFFRRTLAAAAGIAPLLVAVGAYNKHFFGSPFLFGYVASQGPQTGPGFHRDPIGAVYGPREALGFTSSDLVTLSLYLLETPIPAVVVVGLFMLLAERFSVGVKVIAAWALLPVVANAIYWHHGIFMGPRMLNEAAAPWALLTALSAVGLVRLIPRETRWRDYSPRVAVTLAFALSLAVGIFYLGPQRLVGYGGRWMESSRMEVADVGRPALVFVHGGWTGRVAMRLVANGMRVDSLEAALRQNVTCDSHRFSLWYSTPDSQRTTTPPTLDFSFAPNNPPPQILIANGDRIRARPGVRFPPDCYREAVSDTLGIIDVGPLLWQGDLPGLGGNGNMYVRDMGPEANAAILREYPDRIPYVLMRPRDNAPPKLVPYAEGMKALWPAGSGGGS